MKAWITIQRSTYGGKKEAWKLPSYTGLETNYELVQAKLRVSELSSIYTEFKVIEIEIPEDALNSPEIALSEGAKGTADLS
jgi:hypothetical protein